MLAGICRRSGRAKQQLWLWLCTSAQRAPVQASAVPAVSIAQDVQPALPESIPTPGGGPQQVCVHSLGAFLHSLDHIWLVTACLESPRVCASE